MSISATEIAAKIQAALPQAEVIVEGDDGVHFHATVIASCFAGQLALARHRMVYAALGDLMQHAIHALQLSTWTPEEAAAQGS